MSFCTFNWLQEHLGDVKRLRAARTGSGEYNNLTEVTPVNTSAMKLGCVIDRLRFGLRPSLTK